MSVIATLLILVLILFFKPKYRRMEIESGIQLLNGSKGKKSTFETKSFCIYCHI
jgi:hypothetical protein